MSSLLMRHIEQIAEPLSVLQKIFGYSDFRGLQKEAISSLMRGEDVLLLMPTGGGKSLCYQVPALSLSGMALIISPLIALMDDQVHALRKKNIRAAALHSELETDARLHLWDCLQKKEIDLLYISPERLLSPKTLNYLKKQKISLIALDEAHCLSSWGHDFRPEYRKLSLLKEYFPTSPLIALTATADKKTKNDILSVLKINNARILSASFHRENIFIDVKAKQNEIQQIFSALKKYQNNGAAIIYCNSRIRAEKLAELLTTKNMKARPFHAGLSALEKRVTLQRFKSSEPLIIVATIAFGMGIDRADVRLVIHVDMPYSPESYYQQIGRAGRDQHHAYALLLYGGNDIARARYWLENSQASASKKELMLQKLEYMIDFVETTKCRTRSILHFFGEEIIPCQHCDNCQETTLLFDARLAVQKVLSVVYRTGEKFGITLLIDILRGHESALIKEHNFHKLSVFGIGQEEGDLWWQTIIRQLIAQNFLYWTQENGLRLKRDKARLFLRGEREILLKEK